MGAERHGCHINIHFKKTPQSAHLELAVQRDGVCVEGIQRRRKQRYPPLHFHQDQGRG